MDATDWSSADRAVQLGHRAILAGAPPASLWARGLLDGQLRSRCDLEAFVRDRLPAAYGKAERARSEALLGTSNGRQSLVEAGLHGVVHALGLQGVGGVTRVTELAPGVAVLPAGAADLAEQLLDLGPLGLQQRACALCIHPGPSPRCSCDCSYAVRAAVVEINTTTPATAAAGCRCRRGAGR